MGKAIVKLNIATYSGEEYVLEIPCKKDDIDELIISRAWKKLKEDEGGEPFLTEIAAPRLLNESFKLLCI